MGLKPKVINSVSDDSVRVGVGTICWFCLITSREAQAIYIGLIIMLDSLQSHTFSDSSK